MAVTIDPQGRRSWTKTHAIRPSWLRWIIILGVLTYMILAVRSFGINIERIIFGLDRGWRILKAFLTPDFVSRQFYIVEGIFESITMTVAASAVGILLAVPLALGASRNISPLSVYLVCRVILMIVRSLHVVVLAILFVIMIGFGPLAGVITLALNSIGFVGKLLAEDIENCSAEPIEAIEATGATWLQKVVYGVWPQVASRFVGLSIYRIDINFRQSTVVGLVGAGGIGAVLDTAMARYDYNTAAAILIVIIILVLIGEYASSAIRRRLT